MTEDSGVLEVSSDMEICGPLLWTKLEIAVDESGGNHGRLFFQKAKSKLQQGPTCGFVALFLASDAAGLVKEDKDEVSLEDMLAWARMLGFTKGGEMFSGKMIPLCVVVDGELTEINMRELILIFQRIGWRGLRMSFIS